MPRQLSQALCDIIKTELQNGVDLPTLKSRHVISDKKARTMKKLFDETGEVVNTGVRKGGSGRPKKLQDVHVERLRGFLAEHPEAFLKDMCLFMEIEFGLELTESTMQRCCKRYVFSVSCIQSVLLHNHLSLCFNSRAHVYHLGTRNALHH